MDPERWQQASRILESVLERPPDQRSAYLEELCPNDDGLRREVESLLAASERAGSLLDSPAMEMAARLFADESPESVVGQSFGRYEIVAALGAGGMAEVYLANDTRLRRKVALKLLPAHFTSDKDRLRRFELEAHAASTLSHPNVCVIHEIGETENARHYIAMEYVEGVTLRQHRARNRLTPIESLDVAIQVASALAAAHASGIVHRDIKPENIMVRADGNIKVLDFGLAKLTEQRQTIDSSLPTKSLMQTDTGIVIGTAAYMSPEQARGLAVDSRTDIWSLGVVLYEMLAGHPPFEGETSSDLIAAILKTVPPPLAHYDAETPRELENITRKALEKERETRYQSVEDLLSDLKTMKQELEFQARLERAIQPDARDRVRPVTGSGQTELQTARVGAVHTDDAPARTTSSAEYIFSEIKRHKTGALIAAALLIAVGLAYAIYHFTLATKPAARHFQELKISRVTSEGNVGGAVISPDGKYLAYSLVEGGKSSLWTKHLATGSRVQIVPTVEGGLNPNTFTRDGGYIYYVRRDQQNPHGTLYLVPVLGGVSKKILTNIGWPISLSPDGKQFSFGRLHGESNEDELLVANADGTNERALLGPGNRPNDPSPVWIGNAPAAWSPDGKTLAFGYRQKESIDHMTVAVMSVEDRTLKLIPTPRWYQIWAIVWFSDGSGLALVVQEQDFGKTQVWQLSYPGGQPRRITTDLNSYAATSLTLTVDSTALVVVQSEAPSNIWIAAAGDARSARAVTTGKNVEEGVDGLTWVTGGRIVYETDVDGKRCIWIMNSDGSDRKPLTDGATDDYHPEVTADGRYVVFISDRAGGFQFWRMDIDGSSPRQLVEGNEAMNFSISPDGQWVLYSPLDKGIWKVSIDGGNPTRLIEKSLSGHAQISPDGKLLAYHFSNDERNVTVIRFADGAPVTTFGIPLATDPYFRWAHDSRSLIYINTRNGVSNLWSHPLDGSAPKQITDFKSDRIYRFSYTRDGKQLALARGSVTRDAVMINEVK